MTTIFFSWQSDVAPNANTRAIRGAVAAAAAAMTAKFGEQVTPDEATRNVPGSPYIPGKLAEKIQKSDIFVGDVTSIAVLTDGKSLPNPNVTFELGLAAAHLGWDRIILLFNEELATFDNLPFDFDRHRISKYKIAEAKKLAAADQKKLTDLVTIAVETILDQQPLRPRDLEGKSEAEIKRQRDLVNLRWFLRHISIDMLGTHIQEMPDRLHYFAIVMSDNLEPLINSPSFRLYDENLEQQLRSLYHDLKSSLSFDHVYRDTNTPWVHALGVRGPNRDYRQETRAAEEIRTIVASLSLTLGRVIAEVRSKYLEIDLDETSAEFARNYQKLKEDVEAA
ncbi:hypothetical protein EWE75_14490 [Sphingomonas populi]|uniref:CD-NTase-associated protein 12/Pycsar effector protein TIR domain-containing protein n=1 Tax=Sphingomonas populi TaxID=2484750 RepID=A0A4Q6Y3J5_9SPHN|nr:hypothetical protein [Sphingomonas populi]RZF63686.1 hypothetical protein EWE75_14490 [Sphingomonas populi]